MEICLQPKSQRFGLKIYVVVSKPEISHQNLIIRFYFTCVFFSILWDFIPFSFLLQNILNKNFTTKYFNLPIIYLSPLFSAHVCFLAFIQVCHVLLTSSCVSVYLFCCFFCGFVWRTLSSANKYSLQINYILMSFNKTCVNKIFLCWSFLLMTLLITWYLLQSHGLRLAVHLPLLKKLKGRVVTTLCIFLSFVRISLTLTLSTTTYIVHITVIASDIASWPCILAENNPCILFITKSYDIKGI